MGPLIAAGIALGSALIQSFAQNKMNRDAQDAQNNYNSPAEQMKRYQAAGLNPNLIYGSGGIAGNQAAPVQQEAVPQIGEHVMKALAIAETDKRLKLMDAQINQTNEAAAKLHQDTYNGTLDAVTKRMRGMLAQNTYEDQKGLIHYSTQAKEAQLRNYLMNLDVNQAKLLNLEMDKKIKGSILYERQYFNTLRDNFGIEKGDNLLYRAGAGLIRKYVPSIRTLMGFRGAQ